MQLKKIKLNIISNDESDYSRVLQIMTTLIQNSIKFTDSGSITLRAMQDPFQDTLSIVVEDTGLRIDSKTLQRINSSSYSLLSQNNVSLLNGIGLTIVKSLSLN